MPSIDSVPSTVAFTQKPAGPDEAKLKKVFTEFAAGTFYREMLGSMRKGTGKPAYFDGGYAENVFRAEMDRHITDNLASKHGDAFAGPLYDNFAGKVLGSARK